MMQPIGLQRVGHDLMTEEQQIISPRNSIVTSFCKRVITFKVYSIEEEAKPYHYLVKVPVGPEN